jgi:hypothetical protein
MTAALAAPFTDAPSKSSPQLCSADLHITYEWWGDSCTMHFRPPHVSEHISTLPFVRHFEKHTEWVLVPDKRTERNQKIRPRHRLKKQRARNIVYYLPPKIRKKQKQDRFWTNRSHRGLKPPVWQGERRPYGAINKSKRFRSHYPSVKDLVHLCRDLGYDLTAAIAAVALSSSQFTADRRGGISDTSDPAHPYIAASPTRRTLAGGGFTVEQATRKQRNHSWSLAMHEGVLDVVVKRRPPRDVAERRGLNYQTLKDNASRIRKEIRAESRADLHGVRT